MPNGRKRLHFEEAKVANVPGLRIATNSADRRLYWFAPAEAVARGFRPKCVRLHYKLTDRSDVKLLEARCQKLQRELELWLADPDAIARNATGQIYFVRLMDHVKIGFTKNWSLRLRYYQTAFPMPVDVLALVIGSRKDEKLTHRKFAHLRTRGEWYRVAPDLLDYIGSLTGSRDAA